MTVHLHARTGALECDDELLGGSVAREDAFQGDFEVEGPASAEQRERWLAWRQRDRAPLRLDISEEQDTAAGFDTDWDDDDGALTLYTVLAHRGDQIVVVDVPEKHVTEADVLAALPHLLDDQDFESHEVADL